MGPGVKVELTFDPGDLGHINVFDPIKETYIHVPAVDEAYAKGLSLWQHKVIRRFAQRQLNARTDIVALAQAKAEIRALVERDFNRKSTRGRKRHARFLEDYSTTTVSAMSIQAVGEGDPHSSQGRSYLADRTGEGQQMPAEASPALIAKAAVPGAFTDDEVLPVYEADLDLPHQPAPDAAAPKDTSRVEASR
jgi:hypothetical protein